MMEQISNFLQMGGYAVYIWFSYGVGLLVLGLNWWQAVRHKRRLLNTLTRETNES